MTAIGVTVIGMSAGVPVTARVRVAAVFCDVVLTAPVPRFGHATWYCTGVTFRGWARGCNAGLPDEWIFRRFRGVMEDMSILESIPSAIHRGEDELPFVAVGDGTHLQLLQVDVEQGLWVIRTRFEAGTIVPTHKHTGPVYAFTLSGAWKYVESPEVNVAGSFLFEPAGSQHTLMVPAENEGLTDAWFAIYGANLNLDEEGNVTSVIDAGTVRDGYFMLCEAQGLPRPNVVGA